MDSLHLFAGAGGGILADLLLGHRPVCAVEIDDYCRRVLVARQDDGSLPPFAIWDDVTTFDGRPWRGLVDVVAGGFPCQGVSAANHNAKGLGDSRSGLWFAMARIIRQVRPRFAFVENSPRLSGLGLERVTADLVALGYRCIWTVLGAHHVGAPHDRDRLWLLAHTNRPGKRAVSIDGEVAATPCPSGALSDAEGSGAAEHRTPAGQRDTAGHPGWAPPPGLARLDDGVANRVDRTRLTGNGQVPQCAALAWRTLYARLMA